MPGLWLQRQILGAERDFLGSQLQAATESSAQLAATVELLRSQLLQVTLAACRQAATPTFILLIRDWVACDLHRLSRRTQDAGAC